MNMGNFLSPAWWLTTVVGAAILSVASGYLKDLLDMVFSKAFAKWANRTQRSKKRHLAIVEALRHDPALLRFFYHRESRLRTMGVYYTAFSVLAVGMAVLSGLMELRKTLETTVLPLGKVALSDRIQILVTIVVSGLMLLMGTWNFSASNAVHRQISEAELPQKPRDDAA